MISMQLSATGALDGAIADSLRESARKENLYLEETRAATEAVAAQYRSDGDTVSISERARTLSQRAQPVTEQA